MAEGAHGSAGASLEDWALKYVSDRFAAAMRPAAFTGCIAALHAEYERLYGKAP